MKIAIIIGSIRLGRQSHRVAHYLEQQLTDSRQETDLIDLAETPLPLLEERVGLHPELPQTALDLSRRLYAADAVILVTPEYHGSFSGVLKNALDYFYAEFSRKAIGVAAVSAGKMGGINASNHLQHVILSMGAFPLPSKLLVPEIYGAFNERHDLVNEQTSKNARKFLDDFLWLAGAIADRKKTAMVNA